MIEHDEKFICRPQLCAASIINPLVVREVIVTMQEPAERELFVFVGNKNPSFQNF
jgi:hypothetical protein